MNTVKENWLKLTDKQRHCISLYIKSGNKLGSYKEAYKYKPGSTQQTINRNCYKFYTRTNIARVVEALQSEAIRRAEIELSDLLNIQTEKTIEQIEQEEMVKIDATWVLKRAALLADFNIRRFIKVNAQGHSIYDFSKATEDDWYCIQEYTVDEVNRGQGEDKILVDRLKLKTYDKIRALELVGKHIDVQAFKDQIDVDATVTVKRTLSDFYSDNEPTTDSQAES
jgi:phage terminase small subunit